MIVNTKYERYQRQIRLTEFGEVAQQKLLQAKVLVIGAGGLGCPALQYLAAAGVGTIGIVDYDVVDLSNLQRQILYTVDDIGKSKAKTAVGKLKLLNPEIHYVSYPLKFTKGNALQVVSDYDVVIDGTDNFSTRYLVNDACVLLKKPLIYGAVLRFEGQVGVFNFAVNESDQKTNYRDLFPMPPDANATVSCNEAGVLGVVTGIIGTMQATEAIKIITGVGKPLCNKIMSYHVFNNTFYEIEISPNKKARALIPKTAVDFLNFDYEWFCGLHPSANEITVEAFDDLLARKKINIFDVREKMELPAVDEFVFTQITQHDLEENMATLFTEDTIVVFCQTGKRSLKAVEMLKEKMAGHNIVSLAGGIVAWKKHHQKASY